jgi:small subunit ribosomal protein S6e
MIINLANSKTSKTYSVKTEAPVYLGKKLGDEVDLSVLNLKGKGKITGGSSKSGFPMVPFISGTGNKKTLLSDGLAFKAEHKGEKKRRTVNGNIIDESIEQINVKIVNIDESYNLDELFPKQAKKE